MVNLFYDKMIFFYSMFWLMYDNIVFFYNMFWLLCDKVVFFIWYCKKFIEMCVFNFILICIFYVVIILCEVGVFKYYDVVISILC